MSLSLLSGRVTSWCLLPLVVLFVSPAMATVYEGGSGADAWRVADANPPGASVASVADEVLGGQVIETTGAARSNAYLLGGTRAARGGWGNTDERFLSFRLRTTETFSVYVRVETSAGLRWLHYNQSSRDSLGTGNFVHHGLGRRVRDGRWRQFGRDLVADLAAGQPDITFLAVHGVMVRGNVRIDDIALDTELLPERVLPLIDSEVALDAENGDLSVWRVFDDRPAGATVSLEADDARDGLVYVFTGDGRSNGFVAGGIDATEGWNNTERQVFSWSMRSTESYRLSIRVDTADGPRYLNYDQRRNDTLGHSNGRDIGFGLGRESRDGTWRTYTRDLAADLALAEPENTIVAVQGLYVRGSLRLDDLSLADASPVVEPPEEEPPEEEPPVEETPEEETPVDEAPEEETPVDETPDGSTTGAGTTDGQSTGEATTGEATTGGESTGEATTDGAATGEETTGGEATGGETPGDGTTGGETTGGETTGVEIADGDTTGGETTGGTPTGGDTTGGESTGGETPEGETPEGEPPVGVAAIVYEDGEDGSTERWRLFDPTPAGASIENVADPLGAVAADGSRVPGRVIELSGTDRQNGFLIGNLNGSSPGWNDTERTHLRWRMKADTSILVYLRLETTDGTRDLVYNQNARSNGPNGANTVLYHGLGPSAIDGEWHVWTRNIAADLAAFQPDNTLLAVHGFFVRGSGRFDDIELLTLDDDADTAPPIVSLAVLPASGEAPLEVVLDPAGTSDDVAIVTATWDFGDGSAPLVIEASDPTAGLTLAPVPHTYAAGDWTATLTVADAAGNVAAGSSGIVATEAPATDTTPPVAAFETAVGTDEDSLTVVFDASSSTDDVGIVAYAWDFGDGTAGAEGVTATHVYATAGARTVTLRATDAAGLIGTATREITVDPDGTTDGGADGGGDTGGGTDGGDTGGVGPTTDADRDAARLLAQASFGPTVEDIARVRELGVEGWIDDQLGQQGAPHLDYVRANSNGSSREARHDIWWRDAITGDDQLRQRVAFALSQMFVVSDTGYTLGNAQYGVTGYYDALREGAFGSYRELLEKVTLHPVMGIYLSMLQNDKGDPGGNTRADENFAREVLQLFSIGPHALNADGTTRKSGQTPVPAYTQAHVEAYARAFTGWNFAGASRWDFPVLRSDADKVRPMMPNEAHHDTDPKALLGGVVTPAGASARQDLERALDTIANHRNVGPFVASHLIRRLVTSNPSPAYMRRIAGVFDNDGSGTRGNLGAVVKAILMDAEARSGHESISGFGKLREPVLRISHLWRAFDAQPGSQSVNGNFNTRSPHVKDLNTLTGQAVLKSPSVFNFFRPDHAPLGEIRNAGKVAPEAEIYTDGNILATTTRVNAHVQYHHDLGDANSRKWTFIDLSTERAVLESGGPDALLARLDLLLLSGHMEDGLRGVVREHVAGFPETEAGRSQAVRDAITLIMASPAYLVQM